MVLLAMMVPLAMMVETESPVKKVVHRSAPIKRSTTYVNGMHVVFTSSFHWTSLGDVGETGRDGAPGINGTDGRRGKHLTHQNTPFK